MLTGRHWPTTCVLAVALLCDAAQAACPEGGVHAAPAAAAAAVEPNAERATWQGNAVQFMAQSPDGAWLAWVLEQPLRVLVLNRQLAPIKEIPAISLHKLQATGIGGLWSLGNRKSWLVSLQGVPELWEISHDPAAPPIFDGYVHDYRMGEAIATPGFLGVRRIPLDRPVHVVGIDPTETQVLTYPVTTAPHDTLHLDVIHLDVRRRIAQVPIPHAPAPGRGTVVTNGTSRPLLGIQTSDCTAWMLLSTSPWKFQGTQPALSN